MTDQSDIVPFYIISAHGDISVDGDNCTGAKSSASSTFGRVSRTLRLLRLTRRIGDNNHSRTSAAAWSELMIRKCLSEFIKRSMQTITVTAALGGPAGPSRRLLAPRDKSDTAVPWGSAAQSRRPKPCYSECGFWLANAAEMSLSIRG